MRRWIRIRVWLQACEVVIGLRVQNAIERTDHSRLRSAARRRWENVISAQSKGEQSPAAAKFRVGPCLPSKCSERKSVTPYDTDAARVRAACWHFASDAVEVLLPGLTKGITDFLRAVHSHDDRVLCLHVTKHLCFQNCVRHFLWGEQHWQHDDFAELSSVGVDLLASVERPLVEE